MQECELKCCICSSTLYKNLSTNVYPYGDGESICDICSKVNKKLDFVWTCFNSKKHPNGYDLCELCANTKLFDQDSKIGKKRSFSDLKIKNFQNIKRRMNS